MTTIIEPRTYAKKYIRLENPPNFVITPSVLDVNAEICRRPLIRINQLFELLPNITQRTIYQIVYFLFHNGFIARPGQQKQLHPSSGSEQTYLCAEQLGIQLHYAFFADPVEVTRFTQDCSYRSWSYMSHKHNETTALINYEQNAQSLGDVTYRNAAELWTTYAPNERLNQPAYDIDDCGRITAHDFIDSPPEIVGKPQPKTPLEFKARFDWGIHLPKLVDDAAADDHENNPDNFYERELTTVTLPLSVQSDGYFSHACTTEDFFFHETDEDSETILPGEAIRRSTQVFKNNSLFTKFAAYIAAYRKRVHVSTFGITSFEVITQTVKPGHVQSTIQKLAPIFLRKPFNIHPDFLLFYDREMLSDCKNNPYHPDFRYRNLANQEVQRLPR